MADDNKHDGDDAHVKLYLASRTNRTGHGLHQCLHHLFGAGSSSGTKIMLVQGADAPGASSAAAAKAACNDRIKAIYAHVNEDDFPLPRAWSSQDKCTSIGLTQNNLRVHYKGVGKNHNDAASVRTAHPIPAACGLYYFEVKIISKGRDGYMGIGLTAQHFKMNRLPGWDKQSFGYHGDDGNSFCSSGNGQPYGPTFTTGDVIGCGVNLVNNTCFYTKNGHHLGTAFRDLPSKLYPTVGLQTPGEVVDANFGQEPFKFDITDMVEELRSITQTSIYDSSLPDSHGDWSATMHKLVSSYLVHHGYTATAESFARSTNTPLNEDIASMRNRQKIIKMVMSGRMGKAIEHTMKSYPTVLESNLNLLFTLKCRQFVEMVNGSDFETTSASTRTANNANNTTNNINTTTTTIVNPAVQTSVIQSTKAYKNGNSNTAAVADAAALIMHTGPASINAAQQATTTTASTTQTTMMMTTAATTTTTTTTMADDDDDLNNDDDEDATTVALDDDGQRCEAADHNNGSLSSSSSMSNSDPCKQQADQLKSRNRRNSAACGVGGGGGGGACGQLIGDYACGGDVEMENNGHIANGNNHKNGSSFETSEDMDVDLVVPAKKSMKSGVERMLEFGRELFQLSQRLEIEQGPNETHQKMLEDAFSLLAYSNPWSSPLGWQLCPSRRETVCAALNSAILESLEFSWRPPLENCLGHSAELLSLMACSSIGACAFASIDDILQTQVSPTAH